MTLSLVIQNQKCLASVEFLGSAKGAEPLKSITFLIRGPEPF